MKQMRDAEKASSLPRSLGADAPPDENPALHAIRGASTFISLQTRN
jgi:hypothetical protein